MQIRADGQTLGGGDVQQMQETAAALTALGVEVVLNPALSAAYGGFDLVHLFNTTRINETWQQYRAACRAGRPVVISTIWHSMAEMQRHYEWHHGVPVFPMWTYSALREAYYARRSGFPLAMRSVWGYRRCQRDAVAGADAVLPNSAAELGFLEAELGVKARRAFVIPNGFNVALAAGHYDAARPRRGVVCAGRIEPRKNPVRVIAAFRQLARPALPLDFYGALNEGHAKYVTAFQQALEPGRIEYRGKVDSNALYRAFGAAEVVVLASNFETTGLVGLEALACGAKVVVSDSPYTREYFRDAAFYCDPYSEDSIAEAIRQAIVAPCRPRPAWLDDFTWDQAGRSTLEAYRSVIESGARGAARG